MQHPLARDHASRPSLAGPLRRILTASVVAACIGAASRSAEAQEVGRGFLFRQPRASLTLRAGFDRASAQSDIFDDVTDNLTLDRGDFAGARLGLDLAIRMAPRLDLVVGSGYAGTNERSEFRDFVDNNDLPIEQTTTFQRVPVTAGVTAYLTSRGRSIGRFAYVPARFVPYVGGGIGAMWYRFRQTGDFINFETNDVFSDTFVSSRWTPTAHALAGIELSVGPRIAVTGEGKYEVARTEMSDDFDGFDKIDLSGFSATIGIQLRLSGGSP